MALFDAYLIVDWSARNTPARGADSIWYCLAEGSEDIANIVAIENPATRFQALRAVTGLLHGLVAQGRRVLIGYDFPNGYPRGFAGAAGFTGEPWRGVWRGLADLIVDHDDNRNNRFAVAAELNRRISRGRFPFWGCLPSAENAYLGPKKPSGYGGARFSERRLVERCVRTAQPCWKLYTTGSVGGQTLTGIPIQKMIREDSEIAAVSLVWPFETGLAPPATGGGWQIVHAEVYPSLFPLERLPRDVKDAAQVRTAACHLAKLDARGALAGHFSGLGNLTAEQRQYVESEEGWILGAGTFEF